MMLDQATHLKTLQNMQLIEKLAKQPNTQGSTAKYARLLMSCVDAFNQGDAEKAHTKFELLWKQREQFLSSPAAQNVKIARTRDLVKYSVIEGADAQTLSHLGATAQLMNIAVRTDGDTTHFIQQMEQAKTYKYTAPVDTAGQDFKQTLQAWKRVETLAKSDIKREAHRQAEQVKEGKRFLKGQTETPTVRILSEQEQLQKGGALLMKSLQAFEAAQKVNDNDKTAIATGKFKPQTVEPTGRWEKLLVRMGLKEKQTVFAPEKKYVSTKDFQMKEAEKYFKAFLDMKNQVEKRSGDLPAYQVLGHIANRFADQKPQDALKNISILKSAVQSENMDARGYKQILETFHVPALVSSAPDKRRSATPSPQLNATPTQGENTNTAHLKEFENYRETLGSLSALSKADMGDDKDTSTQHAHQFAQDYTAFIQAYEAAHDESLSDADNFRGHRLMRMHYNKLLKQASDVWHAPGEFKNLLVQNENIEYAMTATFNIHKALKADNMTAENFAQLKTLYFEPMAHEVSTNTQQKKWEEELPPTRSFNSKGDIEFGSVTLSQEALEQKNRRQAANLAELGLMRASLKTVFGMKAADSANHENTLEQHKHLFAQNYKVFIAASERMYDGSLEAQQRTKAFKTAARHFENLKSHANVLAANLDCNKNTPNELVDLFVRRRDDEDSMYATHALYRAMRQTTMTPQRFHEIRTLTASSHGQRDIENLLETGSQDSTPSPA